MQGDHSAHDISVFYECILCRMDERINEMLNSKHEIFGNQFVYAI